MSFLKDFFTPTSTNGQPVQSQQQNNQQQQQNLGDSAKTTDENGKIIEQSGTPMNPLDAYSKMFENAGKSSEIQAPSFKLDPKVLGEVSASMDFTKSVPPELMEKALAGDTKALLSAMQAVGRNAYSASLEHATSLTEKHLSQRAEYETQRLNSGVRQQLTSNELSSAPNYDHPVVKAELNRVANQFAAANPDASPQEIAQAAQKYIADLSSALNPDAKVDATKAASGEVDWTKYLSN